MRGKKILASIMSGVLLFGLAGAVNASGTSNEERIKQIYDERAQILAEQKEGYQQEYEALGEELASLGVVFLSPEEVQEKIESTGTVSTRATLPVSSNVLWSSYRSNWVKNGVTYEVQHVTAEPTSKASSLRGSGGLILQSSSTWQAAAQKLAVTVAKEGASTISSGVDISITVYDAVKGFIDDSNFSKTTEVEDITANYTWDFIQTVDFMYVKKASDPDSKQSLAYISSAVSGTYSWAIPTFYYNSSGAAIKADIDDGKKSFSYAGSGHRDGSKAVTAYLDPSAPIFSYVNQIKLTGIENKTVKTLSPSTPAFPTQIT